jgi:hypothetical protein
MKEFGILLPLQKKIAIELRAAKWLVCVAEYLDVLNSVYVMV